MTRLQLSNEETCLLIDENPDNESINSYTLEENKCRYCLEPVDNPIQYCKCKGSQGYIHHECLVKWYETNDYNVIKCEICNSNFNIRVVKNNRKKTINLIFFFMLTLFLFICISSVWVFIPAFSNSDLVKTKQYESIKYMILIRKRYRNGNYNS